MGARARLPCLLAGSHLPRGLDGGDPRIRWIGHVPTLQSLFERVRLSVALVRRRHQGQGAGKPCRRRAMRLQPDRGGGALPAAGAEAMVAEDTHGIARLILALHRDPALNAQAAWAGLDRATTHPSETALDAALLQAIRTRRPDAAGHAG